MPTTKIVRPRVFIMYMYGTTFKSWVSCYPQQKWECKVDNGKVNLRRKGISIEISEEELKKNWKEAN